VNRPFKILIVDDEEAMRESMKAWLLKDGYVVETAASGFEALDVLAARRPDLVLIDIKMPGMNGLELLGRIKENQPEMPAVIITAYGSIKSAVEAMKLGANDYLLKPLDPEHLMLLMGKMVRQSAMIQENEALRARLAEQDGATFGDLIAQSEPMLRVFDLIEEVAVSEASVLITGETGVGKELVARAIHSRSGRALGPFAAINCGAVAPNLLESELFGHERGAFTGAVRSKRGRVDLADAGTLFLDEIGEISPQMQVSLLRVLEEKTFLRVGGTEPVESDFRLICATHRNLPVMVRTGAFRQDFFYRINIISLHVPPLRERRQDIPLLARHFLLRFAREMGKPVEGLNVEALRLLEAYAWPGNVRELRNVMERAVVVGRGRLIGPRELTFIHPESETPPQERSLSQVEAEHIRRTLEYCGWNVSRASQILELDRGTLNRRIKKFDLKRPD